METGETKAEPGPLDAPEEGLAGGPLIDIPESRAVTLRLCNGEDETECRFWVGLSAPGTIKPSDLMDVDEVGEIFTRSAKEGITETGPVMLSDSRRVPPRYIYLLPVPPADFRERAIWLGELVSTLRSWNPESAGFYLSQDMLPTDEANDLILQVLRELIQNSATHDYYLMLGSHGLNAILNSALRLKAELDQDGVNLMVFH